MFGWFMAFRENGAPIRYPEQRTPVTLDTNIVGIYLIFLVPSIAFLIILSGIRKYRISSTISFLLLMFVGCSLLISLNHPCWHRSDTQIHTQFKAFSSEKFTANITVRVGLQFFNMSLTSSELDANGEIPLRYNERISFTEVHVLEKELENAQKKGLPYPILKVMEYLSANGFSWGRQYRVAGYYTSFVLHLALFTWCITFLCLCFLPHMFAKALLSTGVLMVIGNFIFLSNIPRKMNIRFPTEYGSTVLQFRLSFCFHFIALAAMLSIFVASIIWFLESWRIYRFKTIFAACRYAEDSVVDFYRSASAVTSVISIPDKFIDEEIRYRKR
ncbi:unnamed protein product [Auanema sp. JU1783]|nr:unnamed protein product [Auanema sp. JU1783]